MPRNATNGRVRFAPHPGQPGTMFASLLQAPWAKDATYVTSPALPVLSGAGNEKASCPPVADTTGCPEGFDGSDARRAVSAAVFACVNTSGDLNAAKFVAATDATSRVGPA